jgi:hypothetical protein
MASVEAKTEMRQLPFSDVASRRRRPRTGQESTPKQVGSLRQVAISFSAQDRLVMLYGDPLVTQLSLQAAAERASSGEPVVYLDAAHTFDSLVIGRWAKARRQRPRKVLELIHVARAFSWHQMERLVSHCLAGALDRYQARTAVISGLFEALAEEDASDREIARMSDRLFLSIQELTVKGCSILCPCPFMPTETAISYRLFSRLRGLANRNIKVQEIQGTVQCEEEPPVLAC